MDCACDSAAGETVKSSKFYTEGISNPQYLEDDGAGKLRSYYISNNNKIITNSNIGSYDCDNGKVKIGPITTICPPDGNCPTNLVISIKPKNPNTITPPPGTLIAIPVPSITIGGEIPPTGPGASAGEPSTFSPTPETFTFTSPVGSDSTFSSCFV